MDSEIWQFKITAIKAFLPSILNACDQKHWQRLPEVLPALVGRLQLSKNEMTRTSVGVSYFGDGGNFKETRQCRGGIFHKGGG